MGSSPIRITLYNNIMKTAAIAPVKDERFIFEFCEHHLDLGFDEIVLGDNGLTSEQLESLGYLRDKVKILDYKGRKVFQYDFYNEVINSGEYDYLAILDGDELLYLKKPLSEVLLEFKDDQSSIYYNWILYGSQNVTINSLFDCFPYVNGDEIYGKLLIKCDRVSEINTPHSCFSKPGYKTYNSLGIPLSGDNDTWNEAGIDYRNGYVAHYYFRSIEDFYTKIRRGHPHSLTGRKYEDISYELSCIRNFIYDNVCSPNINYGSDEVMDIIRISQTEESATLTGKFELDLLLIQSPVTHTLIYSGNDPSYFNKIFRFCLYYFKDLVYESKY